MIVENQEAVVALLLDPRHVSGETGRGDRDPYFAYIPGRRTRLQDEAGGQVALCRFLDTDSGSPLVRRRLNSTRKRHRAFIWACGALRERPTASLPDGVRENWSMQRSKWFASTSRSFSTGWRPLES